MPKNGGGRGKAPNTDESRRGRKSTYVYVDPDAPKPVPRIVKVKPRIVNKTPEIPVPGRVSLVIAQDAAICPICHFGIGKNDLVARECGWELLVDLRVPIHSFHAECWDGLTDQDARAKARSYEWTGM